MGRARDPEEDSRDVQDTGKACSHSHTNARKVSEQEGVRESGVVWCDAREGD